MPENLIASKFIPPQLQRPSVFTRPSEITKQLDVSLTTVKEGTKNLKLLLNA